MMRRLVMGKCLVMGCSEMECFVWEPSFFIIKKMMEGTKFAIDQNILGLLSFKGVLSMLSTKLRKHFYLCNFSLFVVCGGRFFVA